MLVFNGEGKNEKTAPCPRYRSRKGPKRRENNAIQALKGSCPYKLIRRKRGKWKKTSRTTQQSSVVRTDQQSEIVYISFHISLFLFVGVVALLETFRRVSNSRATPVSISSSPSSSPPRSSSSFSRWPI